MDLTAIGALLSPIVAFAVALLGLIRPRFRRYDRQIEIIEFATKQIEFWGKYLEVALRACDASPDDQNLVKTDVSSAIGRARLEANDELVRLIRVVAIQQGKLKPDDTLGWWQKIAWFVLTLMS